MSVRNVLARSEAIPALGICGGMAAMLWPTSSLLAIKAFPRNIETKVGPKSRSSAVRGREFGLKETWKRSGINRDAPQALPTQIEEEFLQ